jgi:hypothetical protein
LHFACPAAERNGCPKLPVAVNTASCSMSTHPARGLAGPEASAALKLAVEPGLISSSN